MSLLQRSFTWRNAAQQAHAPDRFARTGHPEPRILALAAGDAQPLGGAGQRFDEARYLQGSWLAGEMLWVAAMYDVSS